MLMQPPAMQSLSHPFQSFLVQKNQQEIIRQGVLIGPTGFTFAAPVPHRDRSCLYLPLSADSMFQGHMSV